MALAPSVGPRAGTRAASPSATAAVPLAQAKAE